MIDIKLIENEINELSKQLSQKRYDLEKAKESNLKEQYGKDFGCHNCAYGCCVDVLDYHTCCTKGKCIHCHSYCGDYMPDNELSKYIRDNHYYDENMLDTLNGFFDEIDIMREPKVRERALEMLKLRDNKEN